MGWVRSLDFWVRWRGVGRRGGRCFEHAAQHREWLVGWSGGRYKGEEEGQELRGEVSYCSAGARPDLEGMLSVAEELRETL